MSRRHHVHLGDRLAVIEKIRTKAMTPEQAAARLGVAEAEVQGWMQVHAKDRIVSLDEARVSPDVARLSRRAERLVELIESADLTIRILNRMLAEISMGRPPARDV